jgi:AcrR family transcriptional regulator
MDQGSSSPRGGYAKGDARRDAIIEVATEVFDTLGFRAATMLQIAAACGISRTGLLHHFPTKESLLAAVLSRREETSARVVPRPAGTDDDRAALERLVAVMRYNAESPTIINLFSVLSAEAGDPEHPAHAYFTERYATLRREMTGWLSRLQGRGALVPGTDPGALAIELIALMDGLQVQWVLAPDRVDMAAVLRHRINAALLEPLG